MTVLGIVLLIVVAAVAILMGRIANRNVRLFDESKHENFVGSEM